MSAFLSSESTIRALATYWQESIQRNRYGQPADELARAIACANEANGKPCRSVCYEQAAELIRLAGGSPAAAVFELLLAENVASLQARYPDSPEMWAAAEGYRYRPCAGVRRWLNANACGPIVGLVRGFDYQSCEHASWKQSIGWQLLQQIRQQLLIHLENRDTENAQLFWADWQEPADAEPVSAYLRDMRDLAYANAVALADLPDHDADPFS